MEHGQLSLNVNGTAVQVAFLRRRGVRAPLVCLHGFGSTKEDYADLALRSDFDDRDLVLLDAPGFGGSRIDDPDALSIPFLRDLAMAACDSLGIGKMHILGHSMGGLTALNFAHARPDQVLSFFNVEGNIAPEDCFLSRQIIEHPPDTPDGFLSGLQERTRDRPEFSCALYASTLPWKVRATSVEPVFKSMVEQSDTLPLMEMFAGLPCGKAFVYGAQNSHLSYLGNLPNIGVEAIEIPFAGHFPMYSNPVALWEALADFLNRHDQGAA